MKKLPIDYLKIDTEFVREVVSNSANQHVVKAIIALARGSASRPSPKASRTAKRSALLRDYGSTSRRATTWGARLPSDRMPAGEPATASVSRGARAAAWTWRRRADMPADDAPTTNGGKGNGASEFDLQAALDEDHTASDLTRRHPTRTRPPPTPMKPPPNTTGHSRAPISARPTATRK